MTLDMVNNLNLDFHVNKEIGEFDLVSYLHKDMAAHIHLEDMQAFAVEQWSVVVKVEEVEGLAEDSNETVVQTMAVVAVAVAVVVVGCLLNSGRFLDEQIQVLGWALYLSL